MFKRMTVVMCGAAFTVMTAGYATAQSATQDAKAKAGQAQDATTDAGITGAVKSKLLASKSVSGLKIDVDTKDGVVVLDGTVHSAAQRAEAIRLARATKGVRSVEDKLTVETATATTGRDETKIVIKDDTKETAEKVKDATKKAAEKTKDATKKAVDTVKNTDVKVKDDVPDTKVVIKDDTTQKADKAGAVAADAAITSAVKTKLLGDTAVAGLDIDVDTKDGVVTLTGAVKTAAEKAEALRLAKTTKGVKRVVDKLTIK